MKLMGFSAIKFFGPTGFPVWIKVTERTLEDVLAHLENNECVYNKYFADLLNTESFEKRYVLLEKKEHFKRALLDTVDGDTLLEGFNLLLLDYDDVLKLMEPPKDYSWKDEDAPEEESTDEKEADEEPEPVLDESKDVTSEEESDEEEVLTCAYCGKTFVKNSSSVEWFGMNYCNAECACSSELQEI